MSETSSESTINPQTTTSSSKNRIESLKTGVDSHSIQITTIRLNGDNFLRWSQAVRMYIRGRGKMGYLTGETKAPICTDPAYATWDVKNSMVMTWLVNSMEEDISSNYMCYSTAQELWENINQMYSDLGNQSRIFELTLKIGDLRQGEDTVTKYFNSLKRIWQDLDLFNSYEWKSTEDFQHHKKTVEDSRIFKFLAGLNVEFDEVRGRIIGRQPLPSIGEVFSEVRREESRRNVMLGKKGPGIAVEGSALEVASSFKTSTYPRRTGEKFSEKSQVWCDYCNKPRHTRDTCWKLHGKPPNWKNKGGEKSGRGVPTANEADAGPFTKEQMEHLLMLLKSSSTSSDFPNASMAHTGIGSKALFNSFLSNSSTFPSPWIIDSGASDHMTNSFKLFQSYTPCSGNKKIKVADGGFSPVAGKGSIQISKNVNLKSVLHVPKLASSLLSVSKLTKDSNCLAIFDESHCAFQDKNSRMTIGRARMINGLYCLEDNSPSAQIAQESSSNISVSAYEQIMVWHYRMGHPSFIYLKHLFPLLFKNVNPLKLKCESCLLAKSQRKSYVPRPYLPSKPFYLFHSDVWGPSRVTTVSGKRWFVTFIDDHTRLCWVYLMHKKSEVATIFQNFYNMIENQFQTKASILRSDNGTEYYNSILGTFF